LLPLLPWLPAAKKKRRLLLRLSLLHLLPLPQKRLLQPLATQPLPLLTQLKMPLLLLPLLVILLLPLML